MIQVDSLRDMSERFAILEGTVETYKKKLEELSDLRRQVKILEEKNSQYMQHNVELEEVRISQYNIVHTPRPLIYYYY